MKIYFIRHGQDDSDYRGGWSDLGLIPEGEKQVTKLASFLAQSQKTYPINKLISSDLNRTVQTANIIQQKLNVPLELSQEWREMNNGDLAGMLHSEANEKYPGVFFNTLRPDEPYPNGESPTDFFKRIKQTYFQLIHNHSNDNVAIITHAGVINIIYHIIKGMEWSNKNKSFPIKPATLHVLEVQNNRIDIVENYIL